MIAGRPGNSWLINTDILGTKPIALSASSGLVGAAFPPNSAYVALAFVDLQQKKEAFIISDNNLGNARPTPAGFAFQRWIGNRKILLRGQTGMVSHDVGGGKDETFDTPAGWSGTVIPGTDTQMLTANQGKLAIKKGSREPLREVLQGIKLERVIAVADDLSLFGGVDNEKRLWVQHGLDQRPEVIATGVKDALWGPISHRVMVEDTAGKARVYDGRDRSWLDLGTVSGAQWSPDENRLLFVASDAKSTSSSHRFLSILIDRKIWELCDFDRIGELRKAMLSSDGEKAFLLADVAGRTDVWMMSLTPRAPLPNTIVVPQHAPQMPVIIVH